jgi:transcriptional regulator with XRE-family HTH domain
MKTGEFGGGWRGRSKNTLELDQHIGRRIVARRKELKQSQAMVAEALGVSPQQLQKYEKARNGVSAVRLFRLSQIQNVSLDYYFAGFEEEGAAACPERIIEAELSGGNLGRASAHE